MDDADISGLKMEILEDAAINDIRRKTSAMPVGEPGDCRLCGEFSGRLVKGACARCRDAHKLP